VFGTDRWRSEPPCVCPPARRATWPNGVWGYSTRRHMLEPVRPEAVLPHRALCLPTFSHFLIVNKTSLPLSLGGRSPVSHPTSDVPLTPRRTGMDQKGMFRPARRTRRSGDRFGIPKP